MKKGKKTIKKPNKKLTIIIALILIFAIVVFVGVQFLTGPMSSKGEEKDFDVPQGSSVQTVGEILTKNKMVRSPFIFKLYVKITGQSDDIKAGAYTMSTSMSMKQIVAQLKKGGNRETTTITIKEGLDLNRIAAALEEKGFFTAEEFLAATKEDFQEYQSKYKFLQSVPADREYPLEGYLFGDTYEVFKNSTPKEIIVKMLDRFDEIFKEEYYARAEEMGKSIDEIVIMASVVEREGILDDELPIIAGVFYNRINQGMMLQSCATLQYIFKDYQFTFTSDQMAVDNPYNTYKYTGLPTGPIANFRESALKAALYPADTKYLYFCSKNDGTGGSAFAETYSQHESNVNQYNATWGQQ